MNRTGRSLIRACFAGGAGAAAMAAACIADLPPDSPPPVVDRGFCGDGYIDLEAGEACDPGTTDEGGSAGCTDRCEVRCAGLVWGVNDHCYELMNGLSGAPKGLAHTWCATFRGGHIVTFASEREFQAVATSFPDAGPFWVGLWAAPDRFDSVNAYEPGWAPNCSGCFAHTPHPGASLPRSPEAIAVADANPPIAPGIEAFPDRDTWLEYPSSGSPPIHVICEHEPDGVHSTQCEAGICIHLTATQGTKTYVYEADNATWAAAEARCRDLGGTLMVPDSPDEREQLWLELSRLAYAPQRLWIGLSPSPAPPDDPDASTWVWDDGTAADAHPSPWGIAQPGKPAPAFLSHANSMATLDDTLAHTDPTVLTLPYVCQIVRPLPLASGGDAAPSP